MKDALTEKQKKKRNEQISDDINDIAHILSGENKKKTLFFSSTKNY